MTLGGWTLLICLSHIEAVVPFYLTRITSWNAQRTQLGFSDQLPKLWQFGELVRATVRPISLPTPTSLNILGFVTNHKHFDSDQTWGEKSQSWSHSTLLWSRSHRPHLRSMSQVCSVINPQDLHRHYPTWHFRIFCDIPLDGSQVIPCTSLSPGTSVDQSVVTLPGSWPASTTARSLYTLVNLAHHKTSHVTFVSIE